MRKNEHGETFGAWLIKQRDRQGVLGELVQAAKSDPKFPRTGTPEEVRQHLGKMQVDGDFYDAVDEAETDWLSY